MSTSRYYLLDDEIPNGPNIPADIGPDAENPYGGDGADTPAPSYPGDFGIYPSADDTSPDADLNN